MSYTVTVKHVQSILDANSNVLETRTFNLTNTPEKLIRFDTVIAQSAAETSYLPPGITGASMSLLIIQTDQTLELKLVAAGTAISIPAGKVFALFGAGGGVNDIRLTGNASADANVRIVVGQ